MDFQKFFGERSEEEAGLRNLHSPEFHESLLEKAFINNNLIGRMGLNVVKK